MGAIASGGARVLNESIVKSLRIPPASIDAVAAVEERELARREVEYRDAMSPPEIKGKIVILIDDGLATGATMRAGAMALKEQDPQKLVVAVPVSSAETCEEFASEVDSIICAETPRPFYGVGMWYRDFSQTTDQEVRELLGRNLRKIAGEKGD